VPLILARDGVEVREVGFQAHEKSHVKKKQRFSAGGKSGI
jgi:hypothetical protein